MKVFYVGAHKDRIYHTSRHKHDMFEVVYYFSGDGTVVIEDTEIHFTGGDIFVIPPNTPHSEYSEKGYCTYHYTFNDIEYSQKGYRRMRDNETEDFLTALSQMHSEYWMRRKNWTNIVDAYHEVLMGYIISFFARSSANPYVVSLVGKLEDNISNTNFDVREEMKKIPLNPDYFKKIFTSEMGMTPNRYLFNIRMAHAQKLLGSQKTSHLSIKEIARQCGYENYYYFSRKFSSFYGVSPRGWLKHLSGEFQETPLNIAAERNTVFEKKEQGLFNDFSDSEKGLFPEDAYSVPSDFRTNWFECKNGVGCTAASRALLDEKYFFECGTKSALHNGRQTSLWYFNRKPGAAELPMLTVDAKLRHLPLEFSLDVCNASAQPVKLVALLDEVAYGKQGNSFSAAAETVLPYEETTLTFDFSGQTGHLPLTPVLFNCIRFYVENCRDGEEYKLYLSGFRAVIRENTEFARFEIKCEKTARAGHALRIGVTAEGCFDEDDDLSLELVSSGHVYSRFRLSRDEKLELKKNSAISFTRQLLPYIPEEKYKLIAAVNSYRVRGAVPKRINVINDGVFGFPNVKRVKRGGVPALTVNGGALEWNGFADYDYMPGTAYQFGAYGSNVFVVPCNTSAHIYRHVSAPVTAGDGVYDYGDLDEAVMFSLQASPDGYIVLRLGLNLPDRWIEENPECLALGRKDGGKLFEASEFVGSRNISMTSGKWLEKQLEELEKFFAYVKTRPWCGRVIGIMLSGGCTEEWFAWFSNTPRLWGDYSPENESAFRTWAQKRPELTRGLDVHVPLPQERVHPGFTIKPDTDNARLAAAYTRFINETTCGAVCTFAKRIKQLTDGKLLCGALYGYMIQLAGDPRQTSSGTLAFSEYVNDENIDFLGGIPLLNFRDPQDGYDCGVSATRSIQEAGKLFVNENDEILWLADGRDYGVYPENDETKGALNMLDSTFAYDEVYGNPRQYFELLATWHHDRRVMERLKLYGELQNKLSACDRTAKDQIAFFVDDSSYEWLEESGDYLKMQVCEMLRSVGRISLGVGVWNLNDLDKLPPSVRLVIVATSFAAGKENIKKLKKFMDGSDKTIVLFGPAGFIDPETGKRNADCVRDLTGFDVYYEYGFMPEIQGVLNVSGRGISTKYVSVNPICTVNGGNAFGLGGECVGCERKTEGGGKLIWFSVPLTSCVEWKRIADAAGAEYVVPFEAYVHESNELIAVTSSVTGDYKLNIKGCTAVTEMFTGVTVNGEKPQFRFERSHTYLFRVNR